MNISQQYFEEFIQFAFNEINTPGWRDRLNELRGFNNRDFNDYRHAPIGIKCQGLDYRSQMTIPELVEENGNFEETIMTIFRWDLLEEQWFKSWFQHYYNEIYITMNETEKWELVDGRSEFTWNFQEFLEGLNFEKMMEIIDSQYSLK
jgi:hypothetical protein